MKNLLLVLCVILGFTTINSCKKKDAPTTLEMILKDNLGNPISGASVKLYASQTDWNNSANQVGSTQFADASGLVTFTDLSNIQYYWFAEKDCQNNVNGAITTTTSLTAGITNTVNVIISSTGTLKFVSTSNNPYRIFINGTASFDMNGNTTQYKYFMPVGSYSLRVLQLSGYVFTPTDKTYTGTFGCGQTLTVTFP